MEVVYQSLGEECSQNVKQAFYSLYKLSDSPQAVDYIKKLFNICNLNITNKKTFQNFMSTIIGKFNLYFSFF